jgi:hypothetical protein
MMMTGTLMRALVMVTVVGSVGTAAVAVPVMARLMVMVTVAAREPLKLKRHQQWQWQEAVMHLGLPSPVFLAIMVMLPVRNLNHVLQLGAITPGPPVAWSRRPGGEGPPRA